MKKNILTLLGILFMSVSFAQFTYGPKLGGNVSRLTGEKLLPGFQVGGFVNAELDDRIGLQVDFLWTLKGSRQTLKRTDSTLSVVTNTATSVTTTVVTTTEFSSVTNTYYRFVDVPICVYFPISKHIRGFAGPQLSVFRKAKQTYKPSSGTVTKTDITGITGSISLCAGFDFNLDSPIIIGVRFVTNSFTGGPSTETQQPTTGDENAKEPKNKLNCFMLNVAYRMDW
jgi:hypothetical protein